MQTHQDISAAYAIAGVASFFAPGLGHLILDRKRVAFIFFILTCACWPIGVATILMAPSELPTLIGVPLGVAIAICPNILAAYYSANGHRPKK